LTFSTALPAFLPLFGHKFGGFLVAFLPRFGEILKKNEKVEVVNEGLYNHFYGCFHKKGDSRRIAYYIYVCN